MVSRDLQVSSPKRIRSRSQEVRSSGCGTAKTLEGILAWEPEGPDISTALPVCDLEHTTAQLS